MRNPDRQKFKLNINCIVCNSLIEFGYSKDKKFCSPKCSGFHKKKFIDIPDCLENASRKLDKRLGYVRVYAPMHREANTWGYVYEHRLIAEQIRGTLLERDEVVHHKNGKRWDNRPENLEILNKFEHAKLHGQRKEDLNI